MSSPVPLRLRGWRKRLSFVAACGIAAIAAAQDSAAKAREILHDAIPHENDAAFLSNALGELDALIKSSGDSGAAEYSRGWVLSHLRRNADSIAAYRRAIELQPDFTDAHYNLGVALASEHDREGALRAFDEACRLDPRHVDALYNAGQSNYDLERYGAALARWRAAQKIQPNDIQIARKILQSLNALGLAEEAALARDEILRIWREKLDPNAANLKAFCFDQIALSDCRVFAYELLAPGDTGVVWRFQITDPAQKTTLYTILLERKTESKHVLHTLAPSSLEPIEMADRPSWRELKPVIRDWAKKLMATPAQ